MPMTSLDHTCLSGQLPKRHLNQHKGDCGHVLVVGGHRGMGGAVVLAAEAAYRTGAGLVSVATCQDHISSVLTRLPESMSLGVENADDLTPLLARANVIVVGPGLGQTPWSERLLTTVLASQLPCVIDADALNLIAKKTVALPQSTQVRIITPHPGEAARLLNCGRDEIQHNREQAAQTLATTYHAIAVLKGQGTFVCHDTETVICNVGNPGMATGGMGDVLSGVIAGLIAQGLEPLIAAKLGVCLHGHAGDLAANDQGERGLIASDLFPYLQRLVNVE